MLCGPFSKEIAIAFSTTFYGKDYYAFECHGEWDPLIVEKMNHQDKTSIFIVENLFDVSWTDKFLAATYAAPVTYIIVHPLVEDLQIEPRSLFNYCMPIATDFFVSDSGLEQKYVLVENAFEMMKMPPIEDDNENIKAEKIMQTLGVSQMFLSQLESILERVLQIYTKLSQEDIIEVNEKNNALLLLLVSYAAATGNGERLYQLLQKRKFKLDSINIEEVKQYFGVIDDNEG